MEFGQIIGWLQNEWAALSSAPVAFITLIGISFLVSGRIWKWYYEKQTKDRDARIEMLSEQIRLKDVIYEAELLDKADEQRYRDLEQSARRQTE